MKLYSERTFPSLHSRRLIAAAAFALCTGPVLAVEPFTVRDIRVEGIQRTEAGTVFNYLPVKVGDTFTDDKGAAAIKSLYATGFFKDVRVEAEGDVLVVTVEERPAIERGPIQPFPSWHWRTFPVYFTFALGLFIGVFVGVPSGIANEHGNGVPALVMFLIAAILLGAGLSRFTTRWLLGRNWVRPRAKK